MLRRITDIIPHEELIQHFNLAKKRLADADLKEFEIVSLIEGNYPISPFSKMDANKLVDVLKQGEEEAATQDKLIIAAIYKAVLALKVLPQKIAEAIEKAIMDPAQDKLQLGYLSIYNYANIRNVLQRIMQVMPCVSAQTLDLTGWPIIDSNAAEVLAADSSFSSLKLKHCQVKSLSAFAKNHTLSSLYLYGNTNYHKVPRGLKEFVTQNTTLRLLDVRACHLSRDEILVLAATRSIQSLNLGSNARFENEDITEVLIALFNNQVIKYLNLDNTYYWSLTEDELAKVFQAMTTSTIAKVKLTNCGLGSLKGESSYQLFSDMLTNTHINSLNLGRNEFYHLNDVDFQLFCTGIAHSKHITTLGLKQCYLWNIANRYSAEKLTILFNAIFASNIVSLDVSDHFFGYSPDEIVNAFCNFISHSKLSSLKFRDSGINRLSASVIKKLFVAFSHSGLDFLDLRKNRLAELKNDEGDMISAFCDGLASLKVKSIKLGLEEVYPQDRNPAFLAALELAINRNFYLLEVDGLTEELKVKVAPVLARNHKLHNTMSLSNQLVKLVNSMEEIKLIEDPVKKESTFKEKMTQLLELNEAYQEHLPVAISVLQKNSDLPQAVICLNELIAATEKPSFFLAELLREQGLGNLAVNCLLSLPKESPRYIEAHFEAFLLAYAGNLELGLEHAAFMQALICCLDDNNQLIDFTKDKKGSGQIAFDGYLFKAAGIATDSDKVSKLTPEIRCILLKYVLLKDLATIPLPVPTSNPAVLFQARAEGLNDRLEKLPKITSFNDLVNNQQTINTAWDRASELKSSLAMREEQVLLFAAISVLAKTPQTPTLSK